MTTVTRPWVWPRMVAFHDGRGAQDTVVGQLKTQCHVDYVPMHQLIANQLFRSSSWPAC